MDPKTKEALKHVVKYLEHDERKNYEEYIINGEPTEITFTTTSCSYNPG